MEILIRKDWRGKDVELLLAIPGFDASKWPESTKYAFDVPRAQASTLGTMLLTLLDSQKAHTYIITETGVKES